MDSKNYYFEEFMDLQNQDSFKAEQWFGKRGELVETYSWAIPTDAAIEYIADLSPIVEVGAGKGYWSYLLRGADATVIAYDIDPPTETWTKVEQGTEQMLDRFNDDYTLFLCWPPYGNEMAVDALENHIENGGTDVVYVGEGYGGCTGDDSFHEELESRYALLQTVEIPSFEGIHDNLYHYKLKQ